MRGKKTWRTITGRPRGVSRLAVGLLVLLCLGSLALAVNGCSSWPFWGKNSPREMGNRFASTLRPASGDTDRLLKNAFYFRMMGRPDLALRELEEALDRDPQNLKTVDTLASCYEELGEFKRSQKVYEDALARLGPNQALENNLCFSLYQTGNWQQAEACFRRALSRDPQNVTARNNLGLVLCRQGRLKEAAQLWQEKDGEAGARQKLAQTLEFLGQPVPPGQAPMAKLTSDQESPVRSAPTPVAPAPAAAAVPTPAKAPDKSRPSEPAPVAAAPKAAAAALPAAPVPASPRAERPSASSRPVSPAGALTQGPPKAAAAPAPEKPLPPVKLTARDLLETGIEVRNGNGTPDLAHRVRYLLSREGFTVVHVGNYHLGWSESETTINYRPGAEKVAQALKARFFPGARLTPNPKLENAEIKVVLGRDLNQSARFMAQLPGDSEDGNQAPRAAAPPAPQNPRPPGTALKTSPAPQTASPKAVAAAVPAKPAAPPETPVAAAPAPEKAALSVKLTARDLIDTAIEVRNGHGAPHLAHRARDLLSREGFQVVHVGNYHMGWAEKETVIYYRPGAQKVAATLKNRFFKTARLAPAPDLTHSDIKVVLGHDLDQLPRLMAQLAEFGGY